MVKFFKSDSWEFDMPRELWISNKSSLNDFALVLSKEMEVPPEDLLVTKINSPWSFHRVMLPFAEWVNLKDDNSFIHSAPFYLSTDGVLFIVRDARQPIREMTQYEKDMYRCADFETQMFSGGTSDSKIGR